MSNNKTIKLRITRIAARTCGKYFSNRNCLAATAARRQFKLERSEVSAFGYSIFIGKRRFTFSIADADKLTHAYLRPYFEAIRRDFIPFTIELIPTS